MPVPINDPAHLQAAQRNLVLRLATSLLWTPYKWGGDDPSGLDCSGFMIELLQSVGVLPYRFDSTAAGLFARFSSTKMPKPADLVFWRTDGGKIVHVEMVYDIDLRVSIGAAGGGSSTLDVNAAWEHNAYIRVRPWQNRGRKLAGFRDPFA